MSLTPVFSCQQSVLSPSVITVSDSSTGSDGAIASRRISFSKADGTYITPLGNGNPTYVLWVLIALTIDVNMLDKDYALNVTVDWLDGGGAVLYTKTGLFYFTMYNEQFFYQLTQYEVSSPAVRNDNNFFANKNKFRTLIDNAVQAVTFGTDIQAAQEELDQANYMRQNQTLFF